MPEQPEVVAAASKFFGVTLLPSAEIVDWWNWFGVRTKWSKVRKEGRIQS